MTSLPEFRLESYFARWEFTARYHLTASDAETLGLHELLGMAQDRELRDWQELRLGYTETLGDPLLREAIANTYTGVGPDQVICFAGAEEGLYLAMHALLGPDDHAVVLTPNYQSAETVPASLCAVTGVALDATNGWALDLSEVRAALRPNTKVVSVNFPNNPTGAVPDAATFTELVQLCDERGIHLFSDEVYRGIEQDPSRTLPQAADLSERALSLNVLSKALGLPGLRIGWIACQDRAILTRLAEAKYYTTICNSAPSELLARIALSAREPILARNRGIVAANLSVFESFFVEFGELFEFTAPDGGCVCFPRYLGADGVAAFCRDLVAEAGVLLLPASMFHSELTPVPTDRFRVGVGRRDPEPALAAFAAWLRARRW